MTRFSPLFSVICEAKTTLNYQHIINYYKTIKNDKKIDGKTLNRALPFLYVTNYSESKEKKYESHSQNPEDEISRFVSGELPEFMYNQRSDTQKKLLKKL